MASPLDAFKNSSPPRQAILIGLVAVVGAILIFSAWFFLVRTPFEIAFTDLKSNDAVTIVAELDRMKTPYKLADDGTTILVPKDKVDSARINILGGDLPLKGAVGFELFNKTDMGLTEFAQKINYQRALQGELARTIMALDNIDSARVHLSLPESGIFERDKRAAKASVTIATKLGDSLGDKTVHGVQRLIASAVPELDPQNVVVLDAHGQLMSDEPAMSMMPSPEQQEKSALEQYYAGKIRAAFQALGMAMPMQVDVVSFGAQTMSTTSAVNSTPPIPPNEASKDSGSGISETRTMPLKVTVALATEPGLVIKDKLLATARSAIDFDQARGDIVTVALDPALGGVPAARMDMGAAAAHTPVAPTNGVRFSDIPIWPFAALFGLLLLFLVAWRLLQPDISLSKQDREAFSIKLKSLLDDEARNA